jgi:hypothetical protein
MRLDFLGGSHGLHFQVDSAVALRPAGDGFPAGHGLDAGTDVLRHSDRPFVMSGTAAIRGLEIGRSRCQFCPTSGTSGRVAKLT